MRPLQTFEDVETLLRHWTSFADPQVYDVVGMTALWTACLDNLRAHLVPTEVEELAAALTAEQRAFLRMLVTMHAEKGTCTPQDSAAA